MVDNKKERWFSQKSLIDEVNKVSDEVIESLSQDDSGSKYKKNTSVDTTSNDAEDMERNMKRYERQIKILQAEMIQEKQLHEQELNEVKAELDTMKETNQANSADAEIQEELAQLRKENEELKADSLKVTVNHSEELSKKIDSLNGEVVGLTADKLDLKDQLLDMTAKNKTLQETLKEKEAIIQSMTKQLDERNDGEADSEALLKAKRQINDLMEQNEDLKQEVIESQKEIGEVLVSAKKQANQMLEEAHVEAKHMISSAELELENIGSRAKKIFIEVEDSKDQVVSMYNEMQSKINQLVEGSLLSDYQSKK
ncbi:hypothetical protein RV11_GL002730 [Enterococcus phoeniculicola]|jgi:chromosome segregation ATPase|uniref:Uncharacterized protein n=1 Tax=Enterococcus phoeniculicola ATCC BAA-412 TaxID=1158610 RepID=R3TJY4_9ENTE|nr:hypothetical protein [Enterococcus phoeniculicola]EOL41744.1 hypothetical protein UC3_03309 [Enterococcus phoeniculicola ATCC BAA-412]EOT78762.1 hypothetical protein I589_00267 [Enterococcus phoeniculicola ATCC BAA-412]OJG72591.1 hypothetical protein RV11_GL002730 [Enterococcus phoeniculicola]